VAQVTTVTSESLQAKLRQLLPSQQGFGEDLQASNVILPIIDLTETAEGSNVRQDLQTSLAHSSNTSFSVENTSSNIASTAGFYRIIATSVLVTHSGGSRANSFIVNDGATSTTIYLHRVPAISQNQISTANIDIVVFLRSIDTLSVSSDDTDAVCAGSLRQIADVNGNLVNPVGFTPQ
jgi:hypothetical protein